MDKSFLLELQNSSVGHLVAHSNHLFGAALQVVHVFGFLALLTALLVGNLRLGGWVLADQPGERVVGSLAPLLWGGLAAAAVSGSLMFAGSPMLYVGRSAFFFKLGVLAVAVLLQALWFQRQARGAQAGTVAGKAAALLSFALWLTVAGAGRAIGFQ